MCPSLTHRLDESLITLMWALFGLVSKDVVKLHMDHTFIEKMGELMFLAYHLLSIVVLLNMLIAMMSNSFQNIQVRTSDFSKSFGVVVITLNEKNRYPG